MNLRALFEDETCSAEDAVDICRTIFVDDAIRDAELNGGLGKIRAQLSVIDGKMYSESNPDSNIELDPIASGWGVGDAPPPTDGLMGPLE